LAAQAERPRRSQLEEGRHSYLKDRYKLDIQVRYGDKEPATSSHVIGFRRPQGEYRASKFCHRPLVESEFMRMNGVATYANLPQAAP